MMGDDTFRSKAKIGEAETLEIQTQALEGAELLELTHETKWLEPLLQARERIATRAFPVLEIDPRLALHPRRDSVGLHTVVALHPEQHTAAEELVRRRYAWRGYHLSAVDDVSDACMAERGQRVTLLALNDARLLGTLTLRSDSSAGLLAEETYKSEIEPLRRAGRKLGEVVRLAVEEGADGKPALDALARAAYFVSRVVHMLTDILIEVNPRHVRFYERVFGFVVAATGRLCNRVGAPSVLMRIDVEQFGRRLQLDPA